MTMDRIAPVLMILISFGCLGLVMFLINASVERLNEDHKGQSTPELDRKKERNVYD